MREFFLLLILLSIGAYLQYSRSNDRSSTKTAATDHIHLPVESVEMQSGTYADETSQMSSGVEKIKVKDFEPKKEPKKEPRRDTVVAPIP